MKTAGTQQTRPTRWDGRIQVRPLMVAVPTMLVLASVGAVSVPASSDTAVHTVAARRTYVPPASRDLSALTWTHAFRKLNQKLAREYAFTEWKGIDWAALRHKYEPRVARAEASGDSERYYLALRSYIHELHDGHVSLHPDIPSLQRRLAGGGFGMNVTRLDSGSIAVSWLQRGGPAAQAGIKRGATILAWNGQPIRRALAATSTVLGPSQPTSGREQYEQLRFLVRAPVGARRTVTFKNHGTPTRRTVRLSALDDGYATLIRTSAESYLATHPLPKRMVQRHILPGRVGYMRIYAEIDLPAALPGDQIPTLRLFRQAIRDFNAANVKGIIVDIRGNSGGSDQMVADFMGSFSRGRAFYEFQNYIVPKTGQFQIWLADDTTGRYVGRGQGIVIKPTKPRYTGPVVALVDSGCISSGEGIAMGIKNLPKGAVVGFTGTNGSFGMVGDEVVMPGGIRIGWPFGQSIDKHKVVQIDSRFGRGGIVPDVRVPMTLRNARRSAAGHDVVLRRGIAVLRHLSR